MGKIKLVRVDDRLIHGQVMTRWSKGSGINAIYIIDNGIAADDFLKQIFITTNSSSGIKIKVYNVDQVVSVWNKNQCGDDTIILVFKNIKTVKEAFDKGLPIEMINVGGIAKKPEATFVIQTCGLNRIDADMLLEMEAKGTEVFFQAVPDSKRVSLKEAIKMLK